VTALAAPAAQKPAALAPLDLARLWDAGHVSPLLPPLPLGDPSRPASRYVVDTILKY
jgi:hypothetical protein